MKGIRQVAPGQHGAHEAVLEWVADLLHPAQEWGERGRRPYSKRKKRSCDHKSHDEILSSEGTNLFIKVKVLL